MILEYLYSNEAKTQMQILLNYKITTRNYVSVVSEIKNDQICIMSYAD